MRRYSSVVDSYNAMFEDPEGEFVKYDDVVELLKSPKTHEADVRLNNLLCAEKLAEKFHTLYEAFAPEYGYETKKESAVAWEDVPEPNKKLMIRVCRTILGGT